MSIHGEAQLNRKFMEFIKILNIYLNHFPRHEKYALANRMRNTAYAMYDLITEGQKRYFKKTTLSSLDITHEKMRMQIHLAHEMGYFRFKDGRETDKSPNQLEQRRLMTIGVLIDEMGKMIGGWIKKIKEEKRW